MFINLKFDYNDNEYLFIHLIRKNSEIYDGVKKRLKSKDKNNVLYLIFCMIIDNFNLHSIKYDSSEFKYTLLSDKDLNFKKREHPNINICNDDCYYDTTYSGKMMYNRLKKKLPVIYFILNLIFYLVYYLSYV